VCLLVPVVLFYFLGASLDQSSSVIDGSREVPKDTNLTGVTKYSIGNDGFMAGPTLRAPDRGNPQRQLQLSGTLDCRRCYAGEVPDNLFLRQRETEGFQEKR
jgi:hypothetical protein